MKIQIKRFTNRYGVTILALCVALIWIVGCATTAPDPLAGWKPASKNPDQTIINDYQDYIQTLPQRNRQFMGTVLFFEDGTGRHAINIEIGVNGTWWEHVLFYDKVDIRVDVIKYKHGGYRS